MHMHSRYNMTNTPNRGGKKVSKHNYKLSTNTQPTNHNF